MRPPPRLATCQAIQECHEKKESDLKKTLDLHSLSRMLKALETQLPRVKEALELPDPRLDQIFGGLEGSADDYDEHGYAAFDEVRTQQTMHTPCIAPCPCARLAHHGHAMHTPCTRHAHASHLVRAHAAHAMGTPCTRHAQVCNHSTNEET